MSSRNIILAAVAALAIAAAGAAAYLRFWRAVPVTTVEAVAGPRRRCASAAPARCRRALR